MKEFISGLAMLMILMIFPMQSVTDTMNTHMINNINQVVFNAAEQARFDGYFTAENINSMGEKLKSLHGVEDLEGLEIDVETNKQSRMTEYDGERGKIYYSIKVPLKGAIGANRLFGITDDENKLTYTKTGYVYSEAWD